MSRILFVLGTRPEAIKLCPVIQHFKSARPDWQTTVCLTAQHRGLVDSVFGVFGISPDHDLDVMAPAQSLLGTTARIVERLEPVLARGFDFVIVQGDTTSTVCGALAAFYHRVPVGHVEAGLRTGNFDHPFPEEMNRVLTTRLTSLHFAATEWAAANLVREGVERARISVTGNPVTDAVAWVSSQVTGGAGNTCDPLPAADGKRIVLVTAHRRESFGEPFEQICRAVRRIAEMRDVHVVYPLHPNPSIRANAEKRLSQYRNITLLEPLEYVPFLNLMQRSYLILTDSGGVQEEAPSLGKPVLVMRETTERPEAIEAGTAKLVGTSEDAIVEQAARLLDDTGGAYRDMARRHNPYGDGRASERILAAVEAWLREHRT